MIQLEKAVFWVEWLGGPEEIPVQYNPSELSFDKQAQIAEITIPGLDAPLQQFVRGMAEKLSMELFFDSTEDGMGAGAVSVTAQTDRIYQLIKIESERHAPPPVSFFWNTSFPGDSLSSHSGNQRRTSFKGVVESVRQQFTLFSPEGVPLRAKVNVVLREYRTLEEQSEQLRLSSPDRTHVHVLRGGETLSAVAARIYRRAGEWRRIADENGLEDPRRLSAGSFLTVPAIRK